MLPDDVIVADPPATRQLLDVFEQHKASVVCVERVPAELVASYGVIDATETGDGVYQVKGLVEKPKPSEAPSNLGIVGRYVFTPAIFEAIGRTPKGAGGELQITDAMTRLLDREPLYAATVTGRRYDTGQPLGYLEAGIELMLKREEYGAGLREYLARLVESDLFRAAPRAVKKRRR